MKTIKYFDRHGTEVSDDDDRMLKDGERLRVSMTMRDALWPTGAGEHAPRGAAVGDLCTLNGWPGTLRCGADGELFCDIGRKDAVPAFTDGHTTDQLALQRPGWRIPVVQDRRAVHDAYQQYEAGLVNAYRVGEHTGSGGRRDGASSDGDGTRTPLSRSSHTSKGDGTPSDSRSLDQHHQNMDRLYRERDAELTNAWRTQNDRQG
jgi:hypothetical protein